MRNNMHVEKISCVWSGGEGRFAIQPAESKDAAAAAAVYNSNASFLRTHLNVAEITPDWMETEWNEMREQGFAPCVIKALDPEEAVGILDIKLDYPETYLSLLMLRKDAGGKGLGKAIYQAVEKFAAAFGSVAIRIDVVEKENDSALAFWERQGFQAFGRVELNWTGTPLPALILKKKLS